MAAFADEVVGTSSCAVGQYRDARSAGTDLHPSRRGARKPGQSHMGAICSVAILETPAVGGPRDEDRVRGFVFNAHRCCLASS